MALDPTCLPNRALQRMARLHQWLQDQPMTDPERTLAAWLINRGDQGGHLDTRKAYKKVAAEGGGANATAVRRAANKLKDRGLLEITPLPGRRNARGTNHIRLLAPAELLKVRFSDAELKAGADPLDVDFNLSNAGAVKSTAPIRSAKSTAPTNPDDQRVPSDANLTEPLGAVKLTDKPSSREIDYVDGQEGSAVNLTEPEPDRFQIGRRTRPTGDRRVRSAAEVFAVDA